MLGLQGLSSAPHSFQTQSSSWHGMQPTTGMVSGLASGMTGGFAVPVCLLICGAHASLLTNPLPIRADQSVRYERSFFHVQPDSLFQVCDCESHEFGGEFRT